MYLMVSKYHPKEIFLLVSTGPFAFFIARLLFLHDSIDISNGQYDYHIGPTKISDDSAQHGVSACLLFNDDTHFLIEWMAYHWTTLPLRRLIVAIDPLSQTNPTTILRRWESFMNISIWEDDFYFNRFHRSSILRSAADVNDTSTILINTHRQRQKMFYLQCMRNLKDEGQHWTAFVVSRRTLSHILRISRCTLMPLL